ncbi:hypothetical protein ABZ897_34020 [Nonomuraea sp. NPDC046802]|uniref:hypothetical protein n=1 Tax=Nonomuraea sp. NPDC046802 TaxID=3154919 RepID=UPI00340186C1
MSAHRCAPPAAMTGGDQPWTCPGCGRLWEPLPASPVARLKQAGGNGVVIGGAIACGVACFAAWAISVEVLAIVVAAICLGVLVLAYRQAD